MLVKTTKCHEFGHPEFCIDINYDPEEIPDLNIDWLTSFFEDEVKNGVKFKSGETLQLGWMINKFHLMEDGYLHVLEPDFESFPIVYIDSLAKTLRDLRQQRYVVESLYGDLENDFPTILEPIFVSRSYQTASNAILVREEPIDNFSGWLFKSLESEDEGKDFVLISLYEFACHRPDLVQFMALPPLYGVHTAPETGFTILDEGGTVMAVREGSYLEMVNMPFRQEE